ncbi:MAG: TraB/GumN family protein [Defluviitaleaceae bacterium]|nr:TraB/GumN family protein [Defluviitaleaceae bacterium]
MTRKLLLLCCIMAAVLVFLTACQNENNEAGSQDATPLLWRATSPEGNSIYLFGSIHVAEAGIYPLPSFVMDAFNRSDYLAVEIDILNEPSFEEQMAMIMPFMYTYGRSVADDIGQNLLQRASDIFAEHEMPWSGEIFKPVMWWIALTELAVNLSGWSAEYGIDIYFMQQAAQQNMPILEVESAESQMQMLANFSMPLQIALLEDMVTAFENIDMYAEYEANLLEMWLRGDYQAILTATNEENERLGATLAAEYHDAMMVQRDIHMTQVARGYMADGKNVFFMVGLLHFIVEGGIIELLQEAGYTVERIGG